jgi:nucleotide-binding universal stress UspA family protein
MSTSGSVPPVCRILHPTDFSPASEVAFAHALKLALLAQAQLVLLHVTPEKGHLDWADFPGIRRTLERWRLLPAGSSRAAVADLGLHVEKITGIHPDPVRSILNYLAMYTTDLIVLATHQREGLDRWLHRTIAEPIARNSREMTLFLPAAVKGFVSLETGTLALRQILLPIDHTPAPQPAVDGATALLRGVGCAEISLTLVHVGKPGDMPAVRLPEHERWRWQQTLRHGEPVEQILQATSEGPADLIVMTTQGHRGFLDALRGSTTERVLRGSRCPVLAIPAGSRAMARLFFGGNHA